MFLKKKTERNKRPIRRRQKKAKRRVKKSDVNSLTSVTESFLIPAAINATEGQDIAIIDAPGAFLTTDMDVEVIVILENMVDRMLEIDKDV